MPATTYRIWGWGQPEKKKSTIPIGVQGVAKPNTPEFPYEIVNEMVCGDLGRALLLPIPPAVIVERETDDKRFHVSMDFARHGEPLPPANPRAVADTHPELSCGVILFDLWIANNDRCEKNLSFDGPTGSLTLFDHGRALMCGTEGRKWLERKDLDQIIINGHCLTGELSTLDGFKVWSERIKKLPDYFIRETVRDATRIGLPEDDAAFCTDFLLKRRRSLLGIVKKHRKQFFNARQQTLPGFK